MKTIQELIANPPICIECGITFDAMSASDCNSEKCNRCFTFLDYTRQYGGELA